MNNTLQRYAPSVLSFLVLVVGGLQAAVASGPLTWVVLAQLAVLIATTATTWLVPLAGTRWRGRLKTGLELVGLVITASLPFIAAGKITPAEVLLIVVAVIKALAAELGVQIRTDRTKAASAGKPVTRGITVIAGDGMTEEALANAAAAVIRADFDGPDHRAS